MRYSSFVMHSKEIFKRVYYYGLNYRLTELFSRRFLEKVDDNTFDIPYIIYHKGEFIKSGYFKYLYKKKKSFLFF